MGPGVIKAARHSATGPGQTDGGPSGVITNLRQPETLTDSKGLHVPWQTHTAQWTLQTRTLWSWHFWRHSALQHRPTGTFLRTREEPLQLEPLRIATVHFVLRDRFKWLQSFVQCPGITSEHRFERCFGAFSFIHLFDLYLLERCTLELACWSPWHFSCQRIGPFEVSHCSSSPGKRHPGSYQAHSVFWIRIR